jgi:hypothetical protein
MGDLMVDSGGCLVVAIRFVWVGDCWGRGLLRLWIVGVVDCCACGLLALWIVGVVEYRYSRTGIAVKNA